MSGRVKGGEGSKVCIYQMWQPFRRLESCSCVLFERCGLTKVGGGEGRPVVIQVFLFATCQSVSVCVCVWLYGRMGNIVITVRVCAVNNLIKCVFSTDF